MADPSRPEPAHNQDGAADFRPATAAEQTGATGANRAVPSAHGASPITGVVPPASHRFQIGNKASPGGLPNARKFTKWVRAFFGEPNMKQMIREKVIRDLNGTGPATFTLQMMAYAFGAPKQVLEVELRSKMRELANEAGVSPDAVLATAERLLEAAPS